MQRFGSTPALVAMAVTMILLAAASAAPVTPSLWRSDTYDSFESGTPSGTSILHDGRIVLAPQLQEHAVPDAQYVWAAAPAPGGDVLRRCGHAGEALPRRSSGLPRSSSRSRPPTFPRSRSARVGMSSSGPPPGEPCIGSGRTGRTGSSSRAARARSGPWPTHLTTGSWSAPATRPASTRSTTREPAGSSTPLRSPRSPRSPSSATACSPERARAACFSTSLRGRTIRVLYDADVDEISGIAPGPHGEIYFAATSVALDEALEGGDESGQGYVLRTTEAGGVVGLASLEDAPVTSLGRGPDGSMWVGTGVDGRIYSVGRLGTIDLVADLAAEQVLSIAPSGDLVLVTTGREGSLFVAGPGTAHAGSFESEAFDAGSIARSGELSWRTEAVRIRGRLLRASGNSEEPDDTWSDWAAVAGDGEGPLACPAARFVEWRADLRGGRGSGPTVRSVEVNYIEENLPPRVNEVTVYASSDVSTDSRGDGEPVEQTLPSGVRVTYTSLASGGAAGPPGAPLGGVRTVEWDAIDPNDDALVFDVWIKAEDESDYRLLVKDLERTLDTWDTQSMPDGLYRVKVVASDRTSNPADLARSDERASAPFVVDNTPPSLSLDVARDGAPLAVTGSARDALSAITRVEFALDYGEWKPAFADDGLFDSRTESFRAVADDPGPGEHSVTVRAFDRAGNVAVARDLEK